VAESASGVFDLLAGCACARACGAALKFGGQRDAERYQTLKVNTKAPTVSVYKRLYTVLSDFISV
jgi:hypothetical protein